MTKTTPWRRIALSWLALGMMLPCLCGAEAPFLRSELIMAPENLHNHGSCIIEAPNGDLFVCWFNGSGERTADDCKIVGARLAKGAAK